MRRFFFEFEPTEKVVISGEQFVHLAFVLRAKPGESVILNRNDEFDYIYQIKRIDKKSAELEFSGKEKNVCNPNIYLRLFIALEKGDKMDFVVQKAVELGVSEIVPIKTAFCQVKAESLKKDRLQRIANEACKQCGRSKTLLIDDVRDISEIKSENDETHPILFLYEGKCDSDLKTYLSNIKKSEIKQIDIIIGSEGGFSVAETENFAALGIKPLTLGNRILRAETACIAAAAIVMAEMGELR